MENENKNQNIVEFKDVDFSFGENHIFKGLSFEVKKGEILTIVGPSGCGKSTVLKLITGLLQPDRGEIIVKSQKFGMAFQYAALFNSMTVWENVALALEETTKMSQKEIKERVYDSLKIVGLEDNLDMYPDELSGGMKKRVSIARALALQPEIILYDEPSTGLDPITAAKLEKDIVQLGKEINFTSIIVTHDMQTIKNISDRVLMLDKGYIVWSGSLKEFLTDNSPYPLSFRERRFLSEEKK